MNKAKRVSDLDDEDLPDEGVEAASEGDSGEEAASDHEEHCFLCGAKVAEDDEGSWVVAGLTVCGEHEDDDDIAERLEEYLRLRDENAAKLAQIDEKPDKTPWREGTCALCADNRSVNVVPIRLIEDDGDTVVEVCGVREAAVTVCERHFGDEN